MKLEVNGWWKCGDTGLIIQWGRYGKDKGSWTYDFPLPIRFPNAGFFCIGYVGTAVSFDTDRLSHSAHLVDNATVRVTTDYGLETAVLAIGF
ncbi:gp53-like domain-containing protein [Arsenophonus sp. PmNCSU2021_1]|uniref:gp53-like domain-containing protein n=1 Tax=Arsenophonus sp. PmNCSU2021_1 TaxID=3118989 RepID=UPI003FA529E5